MNTAIASRAAGWLLLPVALFAGIVLGGLGPRRELDVARTELARLRSRPDRASRSASLNVITDVVRIPPDRAAPATPSDEPALDAGDNPPEDAGERGADPTPRAPLAERLADAREAWMIRTDIARNTFAARTGYRGEDLAQFDVVVAAMNLRLRHTFEQFARVLAGGEDLTFERGVRMMHELTGALTLTFDELDRTLPATWRAAAGDDFDLTDFVDPSVAEPLIPVEAQIENRPRIRRGPRRPATP